MQGPNAIASQRLWEGLSIPSRLPGQKRLGSRHATSLLFLLETVRREFQRATILRDGADDIFRCPCLNLRLDFEGDFDGRSHEPGEMGDHLVGDTACIAAYTSWIETHGAVKPFWSR